MQQKFLSLPHEIRDEIYAYLPVVQEPICFDGIKGSMPAQRDCPMRFHFVGSSIHQFHYRSWNTLGILSLLHLQDQMRENPPSLDFTPFQPTRLRFFDPKNCITKVPVLVERHLARSNVILSYYPVHFFRRLLMRLQLREIKIDIRGQFSCKSKCLYHRPYCSALEARKHKR